MKIEIMDVPSGYAGNVSPETAWHTLGEDRLAQLVDVRTSAEWAYVGGPDLSPLGKEVVRVEWQSFPSMQVSGDFVHDLSAALEERGVTPDTPLFFICRSGARSSRAAEAATAAGWRHCFNIATGFEGDRDALGHRGSVTGWKVDRLPWTQS